MIAALNLPRIKHFPTTLALTCLLTAGSAVAADNNPIVSALKSRQNSTLQSTDFNRYASELKALYQQANNQPLWFDGEQHAATLKSALDLLQHADQQGLKPADYDADVLNRLLKATTEQQAPALDSALLARYDTALSAALLQYLHDLHEGRIRPQALSYPSAFGNKSLKNVVNSIKRAIEQNQVDQLPQQFEPEIGQYQRLKQSLQALLQQGPEASFETLHIDKSVHPGEPYPQLATLKTRLSLLNGTTFETEASTNTEPLYEGALVDNVKTFQKASGLQDDGILGRDTINLLNQTRADKIRQIELAMERLRWLPSKLDAPMIMVNIPAFQLWAFNSSDDRQALNMKVIVGKAEGNPTPMLFEEMRYLEFMPYWNIPKSILDKEIMPKLASDQGYLQSQDIELVQRHSEIDSDGSDDSNNDSSIVDDLRHGKVRARQRPGKKNPLGKVKFVFPNKEDVYMHDTPSHGLFERSRRDFSHGCVRVSDAARLAEFVLSRQSGWDLATIQQAMAGDKTQRVTLKQSIPVLFYYSTSFVDQDNRLHFYRDIYGYDAELQKALNERHSNPGKPQDSLVTDKSSTALVEPGA